MRPAMTRSGTRGATLPTKTAINVRAAKTTLLPSNDPSPCSRRSIGPPSEPGNRSTPNVSQTISSQRLPAMSGVRVCRNPGNRLASTPQSRRCTGLNADSYQPRSTSRPQFMRGSWWGFRSTDLRTLKLLGWSSRSSTPNRGVPRESPSQSGFWGPHGRRAARFIEPEGVSSRRDRDVAEHLLGCHVRPIRLEGRKLHGRPFLLVVHANVPQVSNCVERHEIAHSH